MDFLRKRRVILLLIFFTLFASQAAASTPQPPATPRDYVVDLAGVVGDTAESRLNAVLQELERKTGAQVLVLTVQSLDGRPLQEFSFETKEKWRLGQKGKDNGVLMVVAVKDRKYRFEVGYGLEEILPDSMVGSIGRQYVVPYFRQGDYGSGISAAILAVANTIASHEGVEISGMPQMPRQDGGGGNEQIPIPPFMIWIFLAIAAILFITHPRQCFLLLLMSSMGGGRSGGWSGGGGFGGGGGSFGGGGGGSGGGGGASGSW